MVGEGAAVVLGLAVVGGLVVVGELMAVGEMALVEGFGELGAVVASETEIVVVTVNGPPVDGKAIATP